MVRKFDMTNLLTKERKRFIRRSENCERQRDLLELANKIAVFWAGKSDKYLYMEKRPLKRFAEVVFDATDGEVKLRLGLTRSDSLKMLEPLLWQFLDDYKYHYMGKRQLDYYHENDFTVVAVFEHSASCKIVKTGKMVPETKIECG